MKQNNMKKLTEIQILKSIKVASNKSYQLKLNVETVNPVDPGQNIFRNKGKLCKGPPGRARSPGIIHISYSIPLIRGLNLNH